MKPPVVQDQYARFIEAARELGADEDEATFKAKLGVIARQKPATDRLSQEPSPDAKSAGLAPVILEQD